MNKGTLVSNFATETSLKAGDAKTQVEILMNIIKDTLLSGEEVTLPSVGKLKVVVKPARAGRNPATGEAIHIPEKRVVKFTPSAQFEADIEPVV
jgi:DNA-binding protein HU-beta